MPTVQKLLELAIQNREAGRLDDAIALCHRILQSEPDQPMACGVLGQIALKRGELTQAVTWLKQAVAGRPDVPALHLGLIRALHGQGRNTEALACCRRALALHPGHVVVAFHLAGLLLLTGRLDEAVAVYHSLIAVQPDLANAHANLALCHQKRGEWAEAEACYRQVLALEPDHVQAHAGLAVVLTSLGRPAEALAQLERTLVLDPDQPEVVANLSTVLRRSGRLEEALAYSGRAVAMQPDVAEMHYVHAQALEALDRLDEAAAVFRHILTLKPDHDEARAGLGRLEHRQGGFNSAVLWRFGQILARQDLSDTGKLSAILIDALSYRVQLLNRDYLRRHDARVQGGPFAGMAYLPESQEGCHLPKIIGCYELPLQPHVAALKDRRVEAVIDVGSADGYYAVGLARMLDGVPVYAYDINLAIHAACRKLAEMNGVADRVHQGGLFKGEDFAVFADRRTLVFCDIEGAEESLLDPERYPALANMDLIVEVHDFQKPGLSGRLSERFAATHEVTLVRSDLALPDPLPEDLRRQSQIAQFLAVWEARPGPTPWLVLKARRFGPVA